jgi:hypothetical protein
VDFGQNRVYTRIVLGYFIIQFEAQWQQHVQSIPMVVEAVFSFSESNEELVMYFEDYKL